VQKINDHLPSQIRVWGIERTNGSFSSYELCDSRVYEYLIPSHSMLPPHPESYLGRKIQEYSEQKGDISSLEERQKDVLRFWDDAEARHIKPVLETFSPAIQQIAAACPYRTAFASDTHAVSVKKEKDDEGATNSDGSPEKAESVSSLEAAARRLRPAYMDAKRSYRISPARLERLREVLGHYCGTHNFHNYTVNKSHRDPSARRHIISFRADEPILIGGTEWLSLKVHGQSFMMHQIRKMVSMAALVVRTGCPPIRIKESYGATKIVIPKAPGLGLLLERPVFDKYNERAVEKLQRSKIDFGNYAAEIEAFKQKMIYEQIFQEEEKGCQ
jgi:tRNA pseudouridine38-40 synthase